MSKFGIFYDARSTNMACHVTQEANFEKKLFFSNSVFNIVKSCKVSGRKAPYFRSYQPKTSRGCKTPPNAFRVNNAVKTLISDHNELDINIYYTVPRFS